MKTSVTSEELRGVTDSPEEHPAYGDSEVEPDHPQIAENVQEHNLTYPEREEDDGDDVLRDTVGIERRVAEPEVQCQGDTHEPKNHYCSVQGRVCLTNLHTLYT